MNKKRTKLEVLKDILEILRTGKGTKITRLIYRANLSNNSIKPYLDYLLKNELVEKNQEANSRVFTITKKGFEFLGEFEKIKIFSESYGLASFGI